MQVFGRRMGFSGTPSDLIPKEFGKCVFEEGDDGKIVSVLTSPKIVSYQVGQKSITWLVVAASTQSIPSLDPNG